jgi:ribosomal-protein-alanine N-acetyltransferase
VTMLDWLRRQKPVARLGPVETDQAARLAEIHAAAFSRPWSVVEIERLLADRIVVADGLYLGRSAVPCGFALSRVVADEGEILAVAMAPECRGRGYGRPLLAHHLDELVRAGARHVHLEVEEGNAPALALYRRLGFEEVGRRGAYYPMPGGTAAAALTMRIDL